MSSVRTFSHGEKGKYRELVQINENDGSMKIYCQDTELGFPFSEYITNLTEMCYKSADDYFRRVSKRFSGVKELSTEEQLQSEIDGLINLAKYRESHNKHCCLVLKDGTRKNDIVERLKAYGFSEKEALDKIVLALKDLPEGV